MDNRYLPDWSARARCRPIELGGEGPQRPGMPWSDAFDDELATKADPDAYRWPEKLVAILEICATCPVRRPCLESAFEMEGRPITLDVNVPHYAPHREACTDPRCDGCMPLEERIVVRDVVVEMIPSGVFGGVPGRVRQHFMDVPCPDHREGACATCENRGTVLNPNRVDDAEAWATAYAERQGWVEVPVAMEVAG